VERGSLESAGWLLAVKALPFDRRGSSSREPVAGYVPPGFLFSGGWAAGQSPPRLRTQADESELNGRRSVKEAGSMAVFLLRSWLRSEPTYTGGGAHRLHAQYVDPEKRQWNSVVVKADHVNAGERACAMQSQTRGTTTGPRGS